jgi:hypothetical protein
MNSEDIVRKFHQKRGRIRDPRSGIRKKFIPDPDPGSRGLKSTGSRIRNTGWDYRYLWFKNLKKSAKTAKNQ